MNPEMGRINDNLDNIKKTDNRNQKVDIDSPVKPGKDVNQKKKDISDFGKNIRNKISDIVNRPVEIPRKFYTSYSDRLRMVPAKNGEWTGKPGESIFKTNKPEVNEALKKYNLEGIRYIEGVPDFSPVAVESVKIKMTEFRYNADDPTGKTPGNMQKINDAFVKKWNKEKKDGKNNWTSSDVRKWIEKNYKGYVWHECNDRKTCLLIPEEIHQAFTHIGGCKECELRDHPEHKDKYDK